MCRFKTLRALSSERLQNGTRGESIKNDEIRRSILEVLYAAFEEEPYRQVKKEGMYQRLPDVEPKRVDSNMIYLYESGYVEAQASLYDAWTYARIKPKGIDLVEDKTRFDVILNPASNVQVIYGDVGAPVVQIGSIKTTVTGIDDVREIIQRQVKDGELVSKLQASLDELEALLREDKLDKTRLSQIIGLFKTHASWLVPIISELITKSLSS